VVPEKESANIKQKEKLGWGVSQDGNAPLPRLCAKEERSISIVSSSTNVQLEFSYY